jgi:hypothetical protein
MTDDHVAEADLDAEEAGEAVGGEEAGDAVGGEEAGDAVGAGADRQRSDEVPAADKSLVPPAAMKPLANAVVFVVVWSAMVLYTGRDLVTAVGLGVVGGSIYFLASYYLRS